MTIPQNEYKKENGVFCTSAPTALAAAVKSLFALPCIPNTDTKPSAIKRVGTESGTADKASKKRLPGKMRFAVKKAAASPNATAIPVDTAAIFIVYQAGRITDTRENGEALCAPLAKGVRAAPKASKKNAQSRTKIATLPAAAMRRKALNNIVTLPINR